MASRPKAAITSGLGDSDKLKSIQSLLDKLRKDLTDNNLSTKDRDTALEQLKVHGRNVENADPIFTKEGIETLTRHGLDSESLTTSREALRCLANALLLQPQTRQIFVNLRYAGKAADRLKNDSRDDEFLISRILFLTTYDTNLDFERLVNEHQLADSINQNIARHSKRYSKSARRASLAPPIDTMALSETLKLLFNITHFYPDLSEKFSVSIPHLLKILLRVKIPRPPLDPPVNFLINALMTLDLEDAKSQFGSSPFFPKFDQKCNAEHLINILDWSISSYPEGELDQVAAPVITLIRRVYEFAPEGAKKYMEWLLLPTDDERSQPIGKSDTLSSRLLRLSTSGLTPTLRGSIQSLMFELSGKDATKMVKNVGYGFASGFLMSNHIDIPKDASGAFANGETEEGVEEINPVTGQKRSAEPDDTSPPMTQEEKEREAEKLFVLFERLKATGVMNVKNPVEQAVDEGRFEELDD